MPRQCSRASIRPGWTTTPPSFENRLMGRRPYRLISIRQGIHTGRLAQNSTDWLQQFEPPPNVGSNNWVISGDHTESGRPLVANDTHLPLMAPPVWYELHIEHIEDEDYGVRGLTFPGVPFIVIGSNHNGAWGFTNSGADVVDCYSYEFDEAGDQYRYGDEWRDIDRREEEVVIDGAPNQTVTVEKTVHGPLIERHGQRVGVAWTGFGGTRTVESMYGINKSEGFDDVREALQLFDLPTQCFVYADTDGRTMYWLTGQIPDRDPEPLPAATIWDGSAKENEWEGYEPYGQSTWEGFIPFEEKPHAIDPGLVATANQRIADDPDHYIGVAYAAPYRGGRIYDLFDELIEAGESVSLEDQKRIQYDYRDGRGPDVIPELLEAVESSDVNDAVAEAAATLAAWDYEMDAESEAALIFDRWYDHFRDEVINPTYEEADLGSGLFLRDWVFAKLPPDNPLFDDQSRPETMVEALRAAVAEIDEEGWSVWGDWNTTEAIAHPFGEQLPFMNYDALPTNGSGMTVNNYGKGTFGGTASGSAFRMLAEPGGEKQMILPGGNSGDYFSEHYQDQLQRYIDGEYRGMDLEISGDQIVTFEGADQ
ncbi:MAG: penicillin acylase family protein [Natrialbaceae archaeon]|nr:penicillin acylase family protein [Natrialbaceae archaeon]